jgi:PAS domain S-box-containing protein
MSITPNTTEYACFDQFADGIQIVDPDFKIIYANSAALKLYGNISLLELIGKSIITALEDQLQLKEAISQCLKTRISTEILSDFKDSNGERHWFDHSIKSFNEGIMLVSHEVTNHVKVKDQSDRMNKLMDRVSIMSKCGVWEYFIQENKLIVSEGWLDVFGLAKDDLVQNFDDFLKLIHPDDLHLMQNRRMSSNEVNERPPIIYRIIRASDKEVRTIKGYRETELDNDGNVFRHLGFVQDITESVKIEKSLERQQEALKRIIRETSSVRGRAFF